ncbi:MULTISPECIES: hypothetical protein [Bacillaceae]|uniref:Uncharacterized protein n=1 Tax=Domibacillus aminovorans TaxID=29332 RepID=A0A177KY47_9BACI|nr:MULTISPECIES: hypothetical protein [Bacillaceae]OAH57925.1 hypothetical protein AWH48_02650 [Domibacillus aminovorans]
MIEQNEIDIIEDAKKAFETEFAADLALISQKQSSQIQRQRHRQRQQNQMNQQNVRASQNMYKKNSGGWEKIFILLLSLIYIAVNLKKQSPKSN